MWTELSRRAQHLFERDNVVHPDAETFAAAFRMHSAKAALIPGVALREAKRLWEM